TEEEGNYRCHARKVYHDHREKGGGMDETTKGVSRRHFIETAAITGAGIAIVPRHVLGRGFTPPSDLLNIACVGIGGMGRNNMRAVASPKTVPLWHVDR